MACNGQCIAIEGKPNLFHLLYVLASTQPILVLNRASIPLFKYIANMTLLAIPLLFPPLGYAR